MSELKAKVAANPDKVSALETTYENLPHGWIQWKNTEVSMDFHCKCGAHLGVEGDFAYYVCCSTCKTVYSCNGHIELIEILDTSSIDDSSILYAEPGYGLSEDDYPYPIHRVEVPPKDLASLRFRANALHRRFNGLEDDPYIALYTVTIPLIGLPQWMSEKITKAGYTSYGKFSDAWYYRGEKLVAERLKCNQEKANEIWSYMQTFSDSFWALVLSVPKIKVPEWYDETIL